MDTDIAPLSEILFCDDGSSDNTWEIICDLHNKEPRVNGVKLAKNRGHQNVLYAGYMEALNRNCDCCISLDADLQDDINILDCFINEYRKGNEIVFGVRNNRDTDTFFKKTTANLFYSFMQYLGIDIIHNHADYRLMSKRALKALKKYPERNLFLRAIVKDLGLRTTCVEYKRGERYAGVSKYPLKKMLSFALEGITSFSYKPLILVSKIGLALALLSTIGLIYALAAKIAGVTVAGWAAIIASIWLLGGIQLLCIGIVGIYIGKIFTEVKARPRFLIEAKTDY